MNGDENSDLEKDHPSGNDHKSGTDSTDQPTLSVPPVRHRERTPDRAVSRIEPGSQFGPYRIVRTLGRGGMGEVYEAEQLESGHRVALKVLRQSLVSPTDRKRFLREGRLAASVNHPHSVYVYGTDVIDNTPVISMELMPGGTLADRVAKKGPLPVTEAVDATLQMISGLRAAAAVGVLHRDIKPSNCMVDGEGTVKIADYGLSISTASRQETLLTMTGSFLGTPVYASPEQIQGEKLDVRSDIYAVGATLYHLLTGRPPFEAEGAVRVVAKVMKEVPESPRVKRPEIPEGLARVVVRCLEKEPSARFSDYDELEKELTPFTATALTAAGLGLRFVAGAIDGLIFSVPRIAFVFLVFPEMFSASSRASLYQSTGFRLYVAVACLAVLLYYAVLEGVWGVTLGKAVCRLRTVSLDRSVSGIPKALLRAFIIMIVVELPVIVRFVSETFAHATAAGWPMFAFDCGSWLLLLLVFSTARRRNGYAGLHELASGTRVILNSAYRARPVVQTPHEPLALPSVRQRIGPYSVLANSDEAGSEVAVVGFDPSLQRRVWIISHPNGTPPVSATRRDLSRPGRLRWLNGKRTAQECWDAYEAAEGTSLAAMLQERQPWASVRYWLLDLAEEITAGLEDESIPPVLALDRVWITPHGRAKLLDFAAPAVDERSPGSKLSVLEVKNIRSAQVLLNQIGIAALEEHNVDPQDLPGRTPAAPLPLHVRCFFKELSRQTFETAGKLVANLRFLISRVAAVTRWKRAAHLVACGFIPMVIPPLMFLVGSLENQAYPDLDALALCLERVETLQTEAQSNGRENDMREQQALAIYIADRFGDTISDPSFSASLFVRIEINATRRTIAENVLASHPDPSDEVVAEATVELRPFLDKVQRRLEKRSTPQFIALFAAFFFIVCAGVLGSLAAFVFRGGLLLQLFGIAVVSKDGVRASRFRAFWRSFVAWLPGFLGAFACCVGMVSYSSEKVPESVPLALLLVGLVLIALMVAGAVWSVANPSRGLQDKIAGTYLVPR